MKNISRLICSTIISSVVMIAFSQPSYAVTTTTTAKIELPCCEAAGYPTTFVRDGRPDTQLSITVDGIRVEGHDNLFTVLMSDRGFSNWIRQVVKLKLSKEDQADLFATQKRIHAHIRARCSSTPEEITTDMWPVGTTLTCNKGDGLMVKQYRPECRDDGRDQFGVLTLTEIRDIQEARAPNGWLKVAPSPAARMLVGTGSGF